VSWVRWITWGASLVALGLNGLGAWRWRQARRRLEAEFTHYREGAERFREAIALLGLTPELRALLEASPPASVTVTAYTHEARDN
jgi:hypothetical protein